MENKNNKLAAIQKLVYSIAALITISNIILWIYFLWVDSAFLSSETYLKILVTSVAIVILSLLVAGFVGGMCKNQKE